MSAVEYEFSVSRGDEDIALHIKGDYSRGCKGARDGRYGPPIEPDEPPDIEIESVTDENGNEFRLTDKEYDAAVEAGFEYLEAMAGEPDYDYYDDYYDDY